VTDAHHSLVSVIERAAVRPLGIATQAVHLVACDPSGGVWVQQRALDKAVDPGLWDTTMGGLVSARESVSQTLARETWEEAGLLIDELRELAPFGRFTVRRPTPDGYMVEHIHMFEAVLAGAMQPVNQDGEVARFECLTRAALVERLQADAFTLEAGAILAAWLRR
jgi:8-oxo-dGTP pyrophosphatase MutT (NUDIX family)